MDKLPQYPLLVKRTHRDIAVTLNTTIEAEKSQVFDFIAAEGVLPVVLPDIPLFFRLWLQRRETLALGINPDRRGWST